jgi:phage terminase large subunit GpA-like protein
LTVEKVVITFDGGQEIRKYENEKNARNEALDIEVGCLAALRLHPRNWDALEQAIADDAEALRTPNAKPKPEIDYAIFEGGQTRSGWL